MKRQLQIRLEFTFCDRLSRGRYSPRRSSQVNLYVDERA